MSCLSVRGPRWDDDTTRRPVCKGENENRMTGSLHRNVTCLEEKNRGKASTKPSTKFGSGDVRVLKWHSTVRVRLLRGVLQDRAPKFVQFLLHPWARNIVKARSSFFSNTLWFCSATPGSFSSASPRTHDTGWDKGGSSSAVSLEAGPSTTANLLCSVSNHTQTDTSYVGHVPSVGQPLSSSPGQVAS